MSCLFGDWDLRPMYIDQFVLSNCIFSPYIWLVHAVSRRLIVLPRQVLLCLPVYIYGVEDASNEPSSRSAIALQTCVQIAWCAVMDICVNVDQWQHGMGA